MANTVNESAIKKLKVLFTVVDKNKGEFYMDVISQFEVNCQMQLQGKGTATSELVDLLGRMEIPVQAFAILAFIPICLYSGEKGKGGKWLQYGSYIFYPAHMLILWLL